MSWPTPIAAAKALIHEPHHAEGVVADVAEQLDQVRALAERRGTDLRIELRRAVARAVDRRIRQGMRANLLMAICPEPLRAHVITAKIAEPWQRQLEEASHG